MDNSRITKEAKTVCGWALTGFLVFTAIIFMPSFSSVLSLIAAVLVVPIKKWQSLINKYTGKCLKGKVKSVIIAVVIISAILIAPDTDISNARRESDVASEEITSVGGVSTADLRSFTSINDTIDPADVSDTKEASGEVMVWIPTKGGKRYHSNQSCSNMEGPEYVTLEEAEKRGFTPCKRCY